MHFVRLVSNLLLLLFTDIKVESVQHVMACRVVAGRLKALGGKTLWDVSISFS